MNGQEKRPSQADEARDGPLESNTDMNVVSIAEVEAYRKCISDHLAGEEEIFVGWICDERGIGTNIPPHPVKGLGCVHGTMTELVNMVPRGEAGVTLHICLNRNNLKGRRLRDMVAPRVWCVDIDTQTDMETLQAWCTEAKVHMAVESSPHKYHLYWRCTSEVPLGVWSEIQRGLAHKFGGDMSLGSIAKTIRVPGIPRITKQCLIWIPRVVFVVDAAPLGYVEMMTEIPDLADNIEEAKKEADKMHRAITRSIKTGKFTNSATKHGRNVTLYEAVKAWTAEHGGTFEEVYRWGVATAQKIADSDRHATHPFAPEEVHRTIESAYGAGIDYREWKEERRMENTQKLEELLAEAAETQVNGVGHGDGHEEGTGGVPWSYDMEAESIRMNPYTDDAVLERIRQKYGELIVRTGKLVYAYDDQACVWRSQKGTTEILHHFVRCVLNDVVREPGFIRRYAVTKDGEFNPTAKLDAEERWLSNGKVRSHVDHIAQSHLLPRMDIDKFDADPYLLFAQNGVVNLVDGTLRAPTPADYLLNRTRISVSPHATCPWWEQLVSEIFAANDDPEGMVRFIQELFGYTLTGTIGEKKIFIHTAQGSNGKSTILQALGALMGSYETLMVCSALTKNKHAVQHALDRLGAKIEGKRVVILDDLDTASQWNEGLVKTFTGSKIVARKLYEEERDIPNHAKFHIGCNVQPDTESENEGILRRLCIIPYRARFTQDPNKNAEVDRMLVEEGPGIFLWALKGLHRTMHEHGGRLQYPEEVCTEIERYREDHFSVETCIEDMFVHESGDLKAEWYDLPSLVEEVNKRLMEQGAEPHKYMNERKLGKILTDKYRFESQRVWSSTAGKKTRLYNLVKIELPK